MHRLCCGNHALFGAIYADSEYSEMRAPRKARCFQVVKVEVIGTDGQFAWLVVGLPLWRVAGTVSIDDEFF